LKKEDQDASNKKPVQHENHVKDGEKPAEAKAKHEKGPAKEDNGEVQDTKVRSNLADLDKSTVLKDVAKILAEKKAATPPPGPDYKDMYLRLSADFQNFKKRTIKEKLEFYDSNVCEVVAKFLPVLENIERAISSVPAELEGDVVLDGLKKIKAQFDAVLEKLEVAPINAVGQPFDPRFHEAVMHVDDENYGENVVVEEFSKGYIYKGRLVVKHSIVKVAN
jgi:molecular chaperone GrpE